jgi:hypothetical protein
MATVAPHAQSAANLLFVGSIPTGASDEHDEGPAMTRGAFVFLGSVLAAWGEVRSC